MLHRSVAGLVMMPQELRVVGRMGWEEAFGGADGEAVVLARCSDAAAVVGQVLAETWAAVVMLEALVGEAQRKGSVQEVIYKYSAGVAKETGSVAEGRQNSGRNLTGLELAVLAVTVSPLAVMILQWLMWVAHRQMMVQSGG
jgi:hypothetical protein